MDDVSVFDDAYCWRWHSKSSNSGMMLERALASD